MDGPRRWFVRVDRPLSGAANMARDHAAALALGPGTGFVRFYRWIEPTVSLGRNEPARDRWRARRLADAGVGLVRRPTGGRAVLHHRELTYSVVVPAAGPGSMRSLYATLNEALVEALRSLGVPAERASRVGPAAAPDAGPCFDRPAEGEVVADGRKLVGSAQVRLDGRLLQHGSILMADDQPLLSELGVPGVATSMGTGRVTCLAEWLDPAPSVDALVEVVGRSFAEALGGDWHAQDAGPTLDERLVARLESHYRSPEWTWRR